ALQLSRRLDDRLCHVELAGTLRRVDPEHLDVVTELKDLIARVALGNGERLDLALELGAARGLGVARRGSRGQLGAQVADLARRARLDALFGLFELLPERRELDVGLLDARARPLELSLGRGACPELALHVLLRRSPAAFGLGDLAGPSS